MSEKQRKIQVIKISVFITSIFVIFLSVTYAFINLTLQGTRRQVITAVNLQLDLLEDENNITISNALPMYDEVGMIQEPFTFRLVNKSSQNLNYVLKLTDITKGTNKLSTDIVKYYLTKDGIGTPALLSTLTDGQVDSGVINGNQTIEYTLRLWIDASVTDETLITGKSLSYRVDVEQGEVVPSEYAGMIQSTTSSTEAFWQYRRQITSIAFEPTINVPSNLAIPAWDVSQEKDKSVMAYVEDDGTGKGTYKLHIQAKDKIYTNQDSSHLFYNFENLTEITGMEYVDTSKTTNMSEMFRYCNKLKTIDVSNFDTSNVTAMEGMFIFCENLTSLDVSHFDTSNVTDMSNMFGMCKKLSNLDVSHFDTSNVTNMGGMFNCCNSLVNLDVSKFNTSNVTDMGSMFSECSSLTNLDVSSFDTSKVTDMRYMFNKCSGLTKLDVSSFSTSNVRDMNAMFSFCHNLKSLNLSSFNTSKVTDMSSMFNECSSLTNLDVSSFNTSNVENMSNMFGRCSSLTNLDLNNFNTSNVTRMSNMFSECSSLTNLDVSSFNTFNVTMMEHMFAECSGLISLDLSNFDTQNVTDMRGMFISCRGLTTLDVSHFDTSNVTNMQLMFSECDSLLTLDLSSFSVAEYMSRMFENCSRLEEINLSGMDFSTPPQLSEFMFNNILPHCLIIVRNDASFTWIRANFPELGGVVKQNPL